MGHAPLSPLNVAVKEVSFDLDFKGETVLKKFKGETISCNGNIDPVCVPVIDLNNYLLAVTRALETFASVCPSSQTVVHIDSSACVIV